MGITGNLFEVLRDSSYQEIENETSREVAIGLAGNTTEARDSLHRALSTRLESLWTPSPFRLIATNERPSVIESDDDESGLLLYALYKGELIPSEKRAWLLAAARSGKVAALVVVLDRQSEQVFNHRRTTRLRPRLRGLRLAGSQQAGADGAAFKGQAGETHSNAAWQTELEDLTRAANGKLNVVYLSGVELNQLEAELLPGMLEKLKGRELALARRAPVFRNTVARYFINNSARSNAELVLLANLTAGLPFVSGFFSSGADFVVLTRNQFELSHRLAGIYGQKRDSRVEIYLELAPIVVAALAWKTISTRLARNFPAMLSLLPKAGIAYAATVIIGLVVQRYYAGGRKAPVQLAAFLRGAYERLAGSNRKYPAGDKDKAPRRLRSS